MKVTSFAASQKVQLEMTAEELALILGYACLDEMMEGFIVASIQDRIHDATQKTWGCRSITLKHARRT